MHSPAFRLLLGEASIELPPSLNTATTDVNVPVHPSFFVGGVCVCVCAAVVRDEMP